MRTSEQRRYYRGYLVQTERALNSKCSLTVPRETVKGPSGYTRILILLSPDWRASVELSANPYEDDYERIYASWPSPRADDCGAKWVTDTIRGYRVQQRRAREARRVGRGVDKEWRARMQKETKSRRVGGN